jgi:sarcosine oxidase
MPEIFDEIVLGLGAMGSATVYQLARRGRKVLGLDAFTPAHDQGSSHGASRIIRQAYYEHPAYVPLLLRAYELWEQLQADTGADLLRITGGLMLGAPASNVFRGSVLSAETHNLAHEIFNAVEMRRRFPQFVLAEDEMALYETRAGYLRPEECIRRHLEQAAKRGAELHFEEPVTAWSAANSGEGVTVTTSRGTYQAQRLIISAGAWAPQLLAAMGIPLWVNRKVMFWFAPTHGIQEFLAPRFPIYLWEPRNAEVIYGFPASDEPQGGVKVAIHTSNDYCTPQTIDRKIHAEDESAMRAIIASRIPHLNGPRLDARTCMYTMTPDEHFLLDFHREYPQVVLAAGFSGHGFKFSSVIGEILADLASTGRSRFDISLFSHRRFTGAADGSPEGVYQGN